MAKTVKSSSKQKYIGKSYINDREAYLNSISVFRCFGSEEGKERCGEICEKCAEYYQLVGVEK